MWGIKLKLCRIVSYISLYKTIVFIAVAQAFWLLLQLKVSFDLQWKKWKLRFIATCISLQIFWQKFYRSNCWVVLHQAYHFSPNPSFWLVAIAIEMLICKIKYININSSEAIRGIKLKLHKIVHNVSFYKNMFLLLLLNFCRLKMGKKWKWRLLLYFIADILTISFYKCLLSGPLPNILFVQTFQFDWLSWQRKG